jgi:hypothetical protein
MNRESVRDWKGSSCGLYFHTETSKFTLAKMLSYTVLFIALTSFGHSCDHLQGVVQ